MRPRRPSRRRRRGRPCGIRGGTRPSRRGARSPVRPSRTAAARSYTPSVAPASDAATMRSASGEPSRRYDSSSSGSRRRRPRRGSPCRRSRRASADGVAQLLDGEVHAGGCRSRDLRERRRRDCGGVSGRPRASRPGCRRVPLRMPSASVSTTATPAPSASSTGARPGEYAPSGCVITWRSVARVGRSSQSRDVTRRDVQRAAVPRRSPELPRSATRRPVADDWLAA